jgi:hypothetical protein
MFLPVTTVNTAENSVLPETPLDPIFGETIPFHEASNSKPYLQKERSIS